MMTRKGFSQLFDEKQYPHLHLAFKNIATRKRYQAGETIVFQDEEINKLAYVVSGEVEVEMLSEEGEILIAERFLPGSLLNAVAYIDGLTSPSSVVSLSEAEVLFIPYNKLRSDPQLNLEASKLSGMCAAALYRIASELLATSLLLPLKERILIRLRSLKEENDEIPITAEKLAAYLVVSKHRVHRVLNELESEKLIINTYGSVKLLEP
ncbi:Crp/Fnr family transcriptional regulator [Vibrio maritimus]|uniref:Crp/Fnr family transcriptional regulator n=1 Tax=Vibrio maritimus TaxID=990268 RepID=UPI0040687493